MDAKITKLRLSRMLSYDWVKIVIATVAVIIAWTLVFTMTATAIMPSQSFGVFNYYGNVSWSDGEFFTMHADAFKNGTFSYEIIERTQEDLSGNADMVGQILQARAAVEEGDVIFVADTYDSRDIKVTESKKEGTNETVFEYEFGNTYLENFVRGYFTALFDVKKYLSDMQAFVGQYYADGDYTTPTELNEQKIKEDFNARTKKDKRYKKSAARKQGEKDEVARIEKYRDALVKFEKYLDAGVVAFTETLLVDPFETGVDVQGYYGINLCPSENRGGATIGGKPAMHKLMNAVAYKPIFVDEETTLLTSGEKTAENMNICLFDFAGVTDSFEYESLCYIVYLLDVYCDEGIKADIFGSNNA